MIARIAESTRLPVIVLTADGRAGLAEALAGAGAAAVRAKPADPARLAAEVARLARRAGT